MVMFNFEKESFFYQNDVLLIYFIKMLKIMHILGLCEDVSRASCTVVNIDFKPLGRKSDREGGGILGIYI